MIGRRLTACALALAAFAACTPNRDNPFDPSIRPSASIALVDLGAPAPDGSCPATGLLAPVISAPRGHCLVLDVHGTESPIGHALGATISWRAGATETTIFSDALPSTLLLSLDPSIRSTLPISTLAGVEPIVFRIAVLDSSTGASIAVESIPVAVTDREPVAIAPPPRTFPFGGFPWDTATTSVAVAFDPRSSSDPDGDTLTYCWTFDLPPVDASCPSDPCSTNAADPCFARTVDLTTIGHYSEDLVVHDGPVGGATTLSSKRASTRLSVDTANIWTTTLKDPNPVNLVDKRRHSILTAPSANTSLSAVDIDTGTLRFGFVLEDQDVGITDTIVPINLATGVAGSPVSLFDGEQAHVIADAANARIWFSENVSGTARLGAFDVAQNGTMTPSFSPLNLGSASSGAAIAIDSLGRAWISLGFTSQLHVIDATGVEVLTPTTSVPCFPVGTRPETTELWATCQDLSSASLHIFDETTGALGPSLGVAGIGLAFVDHSRAWAGTGFSGLRLVDVDLLAAGVSLEIATIVSYPELSDAQSLAIDPVSGTAWTRGVASAKTYEVTPDGHVYSSFPGAKPLLVTRDGELWAIPDPQGAPPTITAGLSATSDGSVREFLPPFLFASDSDISTGDLWFANLYPSAVVDVAEDGLPVAVYTSASTVAGISGMPSLTALRLDPGHPSTAWAFTYPLFSGTTDLVRIDFSTKPPTVTSVPLSPTSISQLGLLGQELEPFAPIGTDTGDTAWAVFFRANGTADVEKISAAGTETPVLNLPATELANSNAKVYAARSLHTNKLCLATRSSTAILLRSISPTGTVTPIATLPVAGGESWDIRSIAATPVGGVEGCWLAYDRRLTSTGAYLSTQVDAWKTTGTKLFTLSRTEGSLDSFYPATTASGYSVFLTHGATSGDLRSRLALGPTGLVLSSSLMPSTAHDAEIVSQEAASLQSL